MKLRCNSMKIRCDSKKIRALIIFTILSLLFSGCSSITGQKSNPSNKNEQNKGDLPIIVIKSPSNIEPGQLAQHIDFSSLKENSEDPLGIPREVTPIQIKTGNETYVIFTTAGSAAGKFLKGKNYLNLLKDSSPYDKNNEWILSDSIIGYAKSVTGLGNLTTEEEHNDMKNWKSGYEYWRRGYSGVMDAKVAKVNGKEYIFATLHGENKNEIYACSKYINNIMPKQEYSDNQFSGVVDGKYNDYSPAYFAFCSMAVVPAEDFKKGVSFDDPKYNKGPIVWPNTGYLTQSGQSASVGMRHQTVYVDDKYVYVFAVEGNGVKAFRSPIKSLGDPTSFKSLKDGNFSVDSLPKGFDKNDRSFFKKKSEPSQYILSNSNSIGFSIAKIKGTDYYLGVEEFFTTWPASGIRLRISKDIISWSDPINIPGAFVEDYSKGTLHYPRIFNADFTDSNVIDPKNFFIAGMSGNWIASARIDAVKLSVELK